MIDHNPYDRPVTHGEVNNVAAGLLGAYVGASYGMRFERRREQGLPYDFADVICRGLGILLILVVCYFAVALVWALADNATKEKPTTKVCDANQTVIQYGDAAGTLECSPYDPADPYSYIPYGAHYVPGLHSVPLNQ